MIKITYNEVFTVKNIFYLT